MMNTDHDLGLVPAYVPLYDLARFQHMEETFSTLFYGGYLDDLGFPLGSMEPMHNLLLDHGNGGASTSCGPINEG